jgi:P2-related tail formation protein
MAPLPAPVPTPAIALDKVKGTWDSVKNVLKWFTKLTTIQYAWSDGIIKSRQSKANNAAKKQKAETEAQRIFDEQHGDSSAKMFRRDEEWTVARW